ncbi:flavonoid 3'-monooxygenase [Dendrobium catenatum]|uniref:Flavonoid 3'-monooxygenase n=1 Tax=Dendrobium catenatum TaxID=906689 RepID=A0A2I0WKL4_9ASPA|nr:flavonoid 3'-monooxygenase [Dendrobium catenatum]PKU76196.1 Flavonoid 3'-monooxygenase [Dendrobium catenatum]
MALLPLIFTILLTSLFLLAVAFQILSRRRHRLPLPPGPKGWPLLGFLPKLGPNPHQIFHRLSKIHGPLLHLRFGVVDVVVPCSAAVAEKLLRNDMKFINRPKNSGAEHVAYNYQDIGFLPYGPRWRMQRKLCALHLFSSKALDDFQDGRRTEFTRLVRRLAAQSVKANGNEEEAVVDISREVAACVGNSLSLLLLGRRVFDHDRPEVEEELRSMVMELMALTGSFCIADFLPGLRWFDPQGLIARMKKLNRKFDEFLNMFIAEHRAALAETTGPLITNNAVANKDLLTVMLKLQEINVDDEEGAKLTDIDIKALLMSLYAAGSDSNSILAEWALAELIRNPIILERAQAEVDSVVGRDRLVCESDLPNLPLLQAIVKETLRLHPPAPISLPRVAVEDCQVDGYLIPRGTTLLLNIWAIGRDPSVWPDEPLDFRPDRFLPGGLHEGVDLKGSSNFSLLPFGTGRRMCVGMNLGLRMLSLMTATMVHSFDWYLPNGQNSETLDMEEKSNGLSLLRAKPLLARPVPRLRPEAYSKLSTHTTT